MTRAESDSSWYRVCDDMPAASEPSDTARSDAARASTYARGIPVELGQLEWMEAVVKQNATSRSGVRREAAADRAVLGYPEGVRNSSSPSPHSRPPSSN